METSDSENDYVSHSKKKKRNPQNYKRNIIKKARLTGSAYDSHKGKKMSAKAIGNSCR